ncbi:unnamed protein product [Trifolium pratense]|uniref:Uncharacterized protein n=1 Tax=Trifolium pratense TaxID=57577 RepID=A0ACB0KUP0_TRIPR|nr:unnamed protein product [Trifolium pratense]
MHSLLEFMIGHKGDTASIYLSNHIFTELLRLIEQNNNFMNEIILRQVVDQIETDFNEFARNNLEQHHQVQNSFVSSGCLICIIWKGTFALYLVLIRCQCGNLLTHPISNTREHCPTTTQDNVTIEILPNVDVTLHDRVKRRLMNTRRFHPCHGWLEQNFRASEPFSTDCDHLPIRSSESVTTLG